MHVRCLSPLQLAAVCSVSCTFVQWPGRCVCPFFLRPCHVESLVFCILMCCCNLIFVIMAVVIDAKQLLASLESWIQMEVLRASSGASGARGEHAQLTITGSCQSDHSLTTHATFHRSSELQTKLFTSASMDKQGAAVDVVCEPAECVCSLPHRLAEGFWNHCRRLPQENRRQKLETSASLSVLSQCKLRPDAALAQYRMQQLGLQHQASAIIPTRVRRVSA